MLKESKELIRIVIETVAHTKYLPDNLEVDLEDYCDKYQKKTYTFGAQDAKLEGISSENLSILQKPICKTVKKVIYNILIFIFLPALINYAHQKCFWVHTDTLTTIP